MNARNESKSRRRLPSPALVVAMIALMVALGGSALAVNAAKNSVTSKSIKNSAVKTKKLANGSVKETKLADGAVTTAKVADAAITTGKLANAAVTTDKLADASVTTAKLADDSVNGAKLAADSVTGSEIASGSVGNTELGSASVSVGKIEPGAIEASRFFQASTFTYNFPDVAGGSCTTTQPAGFEQLLASDRVIVNAPSTIAAPLIIRAAADNGGILFTLCNISGANIDPPSLGYKVLIVRQ